MLVGAGFSRNAERAGHDTRIPPLWSDLRDSMAKILYQDRAEDAPKDTLRLAEEFRVYLGQAALVEFIRDHIPDTSWRPGRLHKTLMALPWADVLTTNYDTLLERASDRYQVVRDAADLAQVRGPRVIKLHGSVDSNARLVIAEEDYRTYPVRSAAFVNTARQVFLENELCLIGFSGDDPNFLQWSGWVRDHLGEGVRRIYLVGSLDLSPAKRRLLESRNVAPIDFAPLTGKLPKDEAESKACDLFLGHLVSAKPARTMDWQPADINAYDFIPPDVKVVQALLAEESSAATLLEKLSSVWQADMASCPDWLIMPQEKRQRVTFGHAPWNFVKALSSLKSETRTSLLTQAVWRKVVVLAPLDDDVAAAVATLAVDETGPPAAARLEFLRTLLREARLDRNEPEFRKMETLLSTLASQTSDAYAELVAQRLLWARDGLDLVAVSTGVAELTGPDPMWRLLRAALHCECGETVLAKTLVEAACVDLADRQRRDPRSMSVASRREWADVFGRALRMSESLMRETPVPSHGLASGYDADEEIDKLHRELRANRLRRIEEPRGYQPRFGPGAYKDHSKTVHFRSAALGYEAETVFRLADASCLPLRAANVDILASLAREALESEPLPTLKWHLRLLRVLSHSSPELDRHFDAASIARLEPSLASELTARVFAAIRFWRERARPGGASAYLDAVERLRLYLTVLSRLIVRAAAATALEAFELGRELASAQPHYWLYESLGELLKWSLASLPPDLRSGVALECLEFPLSPVTEQVPFYWPDPAAELFARGTPPVRPPSDARWNSCVAKLLAAVGATGPSRAQAVHRLAYLALYGCLEPKERDEFGRFLWSSTNPKKGGLPLDVDLFPHVIAALPGTADVTPETVVRAYLFATPLGQVADQQRLECIDAAAHGRAPVDRILPTREQAVSLLDGLAALAIGVPDNDDPFRSHARDRLAICVGRVLGSAILPSVDSADLTEERLGFLEARAGLGTGGGVLAGWYQLTRLLPHRTEKVSADLKRAMARGDIHDVAGACQSIGHWAEAAKSGQSPLLPESLKEAVIASLEVGVRPALQPRLWCGRLLLQSGALSSPQAKALSSLLPDIWEGLAYERIPQEGSEAIGVTAARGECVRLATSLTAAGHPVRGNITDVSNDPLPEVRFANLNPD